MIYRARRSKAVTAWIADKRGAWSPSTLDASPSSALHCPGFHLYRGFTGCPAWAAGKPCSYCFLKTTFSGQRDPELRNGVAWVDAPRSTLHSPLSISNARAAVEKWLAAEPLRECRHDGEWYIIPFVLNAGELADSLAVPPADNPHIAMLLDLFSDPATNPHGHKLLLLTKGGLEATQAHLAGRIPSENVILSWSIGNDTDAEPYWEPPLRRLGAALVAARAGWHIRLRLDPLCFTGPWFVANIAHEIARLSASSAQSAAGRCPELITLGTLRHRGGRPKLPAENRAAIYQAALEGLRDGGYEGDVGLCKETPEMIRDILGLEPSDMRCNCMP
jgi:hypothetical protein